MSAPHPDPLDTARRLREQARRLREAAGYAEDPRARQRDLDDALALEARAEKLGREART